MTKNIMPRQIFCAIRRLLFEAAISPFREYHIFVILSIVSMEFTGKYIFQILTVAWFLLPGNQYIPG